MLNTIELMSNKSKHKQKTKLLVLLLVTKQLCVHDRSNAFSFHLTCSNGIQADLVNTFDIIHITQLPVVFLSVLENGEL